MNRPPPIFRPGLMAYSDARCLGACRFSLINAIQTGLARGTEQMHGQMWRSLVCMSISLTAVMVRQPVRWAKETGRSPLQWDLVQK
jgi:hypothetical protein